MFGTFRSVKPGEGEARAQGSMTDQAGKEEGPKKADAGPKDAQPGPTQPLKPRRRRPGGFAGLVCATLVLLVTLAIILGIVALVLWLVFRAHKPRFYVQSAAIYQLNLSDGSVSTNMQFTVICRNPNRRVGVYYDRLWASVSYRGQQITMVSPLPSFYEGHRGVFVLSPFVAGNVVPVSRDVFNGLSADQAYGLVEMRLVMRGRVRWKVGTWKSAHYHLHVQCDVLMGLREGSGGGQIPLLGGHRCGVDV